MPRNSQNMKILIIDDNPYLLRVFTKMLQINNFSVTAETKLQSGLQHLENELYHAVFVDAPLGNYDEEQLLTLFRKNQIFQKTAVFLFSGIDFKQTELDKWKKHGLYSYLKKPVKRNVIIKKLNDLPLKMIPMIQTISESKDEEATSEQLMRLEQLEKQIQELESQSEPIAENPIMNDLLIKQHQIISNSLRTNIVFLSNYFFE